MKIIEVLNEIIEKIYDIENCGGDWNPECKDILSNSCLNCCRGLRLLEEIKVNNLINNKKENQGETKTKLTLKE